MENGIFQNILSLFSLIVTSVYVFYTYKIRDIASKELAMRMKPKLMTKPFEQFVDKSTLHIFKELHNNGDSAFEILSATLTYSCFDKQFLLNPVSVELPLYLKSQDEIKLQFSVLLNESTQLDFIEYMSIEIVYFGLDEIEHKKKEDIPINNSTNII